MVPQMVSALSSDFLNDNNPEFKITFELLNGYNYLYWTNVVTLFISRKSKLSFLTRKKIAPDLDALDFEE